MQTADLLIGGTMLVAVRKRGTLALKRSLV